KSQTTQGAKPGIFRMVLFFDGCLNQLDPFQRFLPRQRHALKLREDIDSSDYFSKDCVFAVEVRRRPENYEERRSGGINRSPSRHREHTAQMHAAAEFGFQIVDPPVRRMRSSACTSTAESALNNESRDHPVERSVVIPSRLYKHQEVADSFRRYFGLHPD